GGCGPRSAPCVCTADGPPTTSWWAAGGFVKSDVDINYSLIEVRLYTKQGTLKYQTDCAPNNGYFMIPLYDKGDFVLKIEPPLGWSFEPPSVHLHVDGVSDICTKGEDVNFVFTGFSVTGKVRTMSPIVLLAFTSRHMLGTDGVDKAAATMVQVKNGNAQTLGPLLVAGYDVSGSVHSDGEPMKGVLFLLFSSSISQEDILGCDLSPVEGFQGKDESVSYLCHATSKEDGSCTFLSLPSGDYNVIPFYREERITFDVAPSRLDFTVEHDSLKLEPEFHIMGFSVTGRVLNSLDGEGVADAVVTLNNRIKVLTNVWRT
ncbi:carbohydrate binding, partial [Pristimantis euphronides]